MPQWRINIFLKRGGIARSSVNTMAESLKVLVTQSCMTLFDPIDYSPPESSAHGILQARMLECVAMPSSRGSSWPRDWTCIFYVPSIGRQVLYPWHHLGSPYPTKILRLSGRVVLDNKRATDYLLVEQIDICAVVQNTWDTWINSSGEVERYPSTRSLSKPRGLRKWLFQWSLSLTYLILTDLGLGDHSFRVRSRDWELSGLW